MRSYTKECFWSLLDITFASSEDRDWIISESFALLDDFEQKYSRFISWNILSEINKKKQGVLPDEIMTLVGLAQKVSQMTKWYFDITLLPVLENNGYGIESEILEDSLWYENIVCKWNKIILNNDVSIEFWAFWKWYALDLIYNNLISVSDDFVINFWWDIRVAWKKSIQLEDPRNTTKSIWSIELQDMSIASSSGNRRKLHVWHHLINPKSKNSQEDKIAVYVTHKLGVFADIFATALFVTPIEDALILLENTSWLEALLIWSDGKIYKSVWFNCSLTI